VIGYPSGKCYLACSGLPIESRKKNFPESQAINPLLTKLVQSRWLDIGLVLFWEFVVLDLPWSIKMQKKKRTWPISSHLDLMLGQ